MFQYADDAVMGNIVTENSELSMGIYDIPL